MYSEYGIIGSAGQAGVPASVPLHAAGGLCRVVQRCAALQLYTAAYMLAQIVAESHAPNLDVGGAGVACSGCEW